MSCSVYDWKAYALGELDPNDRRIAEAHADSCPDCRDSVAQVRLTLDALSTLRDEEIPRRIAFVSDKVFEPRWWRRAFQPSFAGACVVAAAILVHGFMRPASVDPAVLQAAVTKAVAQVEERHAEQNAAMLADYEMVSKYLQKIYVMNTGLVRQ